MVDNYYDVTFTVNARIKINDDVLKQVDKDWKNTFYDLKTDSDIVEMIAYNLLIGRPLSRLDGFANLPNEYANWELDPEYQVEMIEKVD